MTITSQNIFATLEATWPAAKYENYDGWLIRDGAGGGSRVSSVTLEDDTKLPTLEPLLAEKSPSLFMVRSEQEALDAALDAHGFKIKDPVVIYGCDIDQLAGHEVPPVSAFHFWPPLEIQRELWLEGGIGPERLAVMARAPMPKTGALCRWKDRAAGTAFIGIDNDIAMLHALEVTQSRRRMGAAQNLMYGAANWAREMGARYFSVIVTEANGPANALYASLGMEVVESYHYRHREETAT
ncbi:MAG: GNAT family N-acetyltransferase [Halocynthiibacter sp.]